MVNSVRCSQRAASCQEICDNLKPQGKVCGLHPCYLPVSESAAMCFTSLIPAGNGGIQFPTTGVTCSH